MIRDIVEYKFIVPYLWDKFILGGCKFHAGGEKQQYTRFI